jgi:energy-coupling factor transporter ATP-binding protein EcfA2
MPLIEVRGLSFRYAGTEDWALRSVSLSIEKGEFVLIAGPTGCGKSTLLKCLNGLIPHIYAGEYVGSVRVNDLDPASTPTHLMSQHVGMVLQNPENQLFSLTVEGDIAFALENIGLDRPEMLRRVEKVLRELGLEELRRRSPHELSGGQKQKVAIASVLALQPEVLLLDEPTSSLDPASARSIIDLLAKLSKQDGLTVILTEHRLDLLLHHLTRLVVMDSGRIIYNDHPRKVMEMIPIDDSLIPIPKLIRLVRAMRREYGFSGCLPLTVEELLESLVGR